MSTLLVDAPARTKAWPSLAALALGGFGIGTTEFATMGVLPDVTGDLGATIPQGGHLISAYALGVVVGAPLLAVLGARLPRKMLLLVLMAAFVVGNGLSALAPSFGLLELARFGVGAVGFGGFFAVYSYISPTLTTLSGFSVAAVPAALALFGIGMTVGTEIGGRLADRDVVRTIYLGMAAAGAMLLLITVTAHHPVTAGLSIFLIGASGSLCLPALQTRLMDVAGDAQSLAAAGLAVLAISRRVERTTVPAQVP